MVYSGLALRLRYVRRRDQTEWCTVGSVGQFEEEASAVWGATGCTGPMVEGTDEKMRLVVAALDAGRGAVDWPVAALSAKAVPGSGR